MKTINALLFGLLALIGTSLNAQQSVEIDTDSLYISYTPCPTPAFASFFQISGEADNYNSATDSVEIIVFWGDGASDSVMLPLIESGTTDYFFTNFNISHTYNLSGIYVTSIVATMPNSVADTAAPLNQVAVSSSCITIDGYTYSDQNANCLLNAGDDTLSWQTVRITDNNGNLLSFDYSDSDGYFSMQVPSGLSSLDISADSWYGMSTACPASGSYTFNSNSSQSFDFGMDCINSNIDASTWSNAFVGLAGQNGWVLAQASILSCDTTNFNFQDTLTIIIDTNYVSYVGPETGYPAPNAVNGNEISWYFNYNTINYNNTSYFGYGYGPLVRIITKTDTSVQLGDTACFSALVPAQFNELNSVDNESYYCREVNVSYDPNNKINLPSGVGALGKIDTSTQSISYRINFQNTGTAPAQNIYIIDTISDKFDLASMRFKGTSHPPTFSFRYLDNNIVRFDFQEIFLPDSASDPEGSQGYVDFEIDLKPNLPIGTTIENTGYIYFDWNEPIVTNTAVNTLYVEPIIEEPAEDIVISFLKGDVTCMENDNGKVSTTVMGGVMPYSFAWNNGDTTMNLKALAPGTFTLSVTDDAGTLETSSVIIEENRQFDAPVVGEITGELEVIAWTNYTYDVPSTNGSSFEWIVEGGDLISSTANTAEIMWRAGPDGSLSILETDVNGCTQTESIEVPIEFLGINDVSEKGVIIYPNPTNGQFTTRLNSKTGKEQLTITDVHGRLVLTQALIAQESIVDASRLNPGIYSVQISTETMSTTLRLIVK